MTTVVVFVPDMTIGVKVTPVNFMASTLPTVPTSLINTLALFVVETSATIQLPIRRPVPVVPGINQQELKPVGQVVCCRVPALTPSIISVGAASEWTGVITTPTMSSPHKNANVHFLFIVPSLLITSTQTSPAPSYARFSSHTTPTDGEPSNEGIVPRRRVLLMLGLSGLYTEAFTEQLAAWTAR